MLDAISPDVLVRQFIGALFFPPLNGLLLLLGGLYCRRRALRWAPYVIAASVVLLYLQSTPWLAMSLARVLETAPVASLDQVRKTQAIVVLGGGKRPAPEYAANVLGGDSYARLRYAAYLARASGLPLLVSGGAPSGGEAEAAIMARALLNEYGHVARWVESGSQTTADNAQLSAGILHAAGIGRITLVTQAWHMPRALPLFEAQHLQVLAAPTGFTLHDGIALQRWLPSGRAMQEVHQAEREILAWFYYRLRDVFAGVKS